ncbi:MAG: hypothetical protein OXN21_04785 [Chloroflexota bacterium]|nr:hypothetical protein [Chloroflexota bacterium]
MDAEQTGIDSSRNVEDLHHLRLMALLDELVQDKGVMRAARELGVNHRITSAGLEWLRDEERLMLVELAFLEEHGLTLPPQTYPLWGLDRSGQTNWRRKTLEDARPARQRRERLRWFLRTLRTKLRRR